MQISPNLHFQVIWQVDLRWPLTLICDLLTAWTCEGSHIISINQIRFPSDFQLFKWGHFHIFSLSYNLTSDDLWPWYMTSDCMNIWRFLYYIYKPSLVPIKLKLFKWGHFRIFSLSYNLTSDYLWPWYVTFNLINKWGFPCCIYDPTLVEIRQSMWKLEPNVNLFSQQTTTTTTSTDNISGQWSLCVFPPKAGGTKSTLFPVHNSVKLTFAGRFRTAKAVRTFHFCIKTRILYHACCLIHCAKASCGRTFPRMTSIQGQRRKEENNFCFWFLTDGQWKYGFCCPRLG